MRLPTRDTRPSTLSVDSLEDRMMLSTVKIIAAGSENTETMQLRINNQTVQARNNVGGNANTGQFQTFTWSTPDTITADQVRVFFTNDNFDPANGIDANLRVDAIIIDGTRFETESASVFSTGTWRAEDGIVAGNRQSEFLHVAGYFQYAGSGDNGSTQITVNARGTTGQELSLIHI